jgi:hypothetical protein
MTRSNSVLDHGPLIIDDRLHALGEAQAVANGDEQEVRVGIEPQARLMSVVTRGARRWEAGAHALGLHDDRGAPGVEVARLLSA